MVFFRDCFCWEEEGEYLSVLDVNVIFGEMC